MLDFIFLCGLAAWSLGLGCWILGRFGRLPEDAVATLALALPLGLGSLGLAAMTLGLFSRLDLAHVESVIGFGWLLAAWGILGLLRSHRRIEPTASPRAEAPDKVLAVLLLAGLAGTLLTAMAPVTDGDALCYHLQVPKVFLNQGALTFDPDLHETVYPLLTEMLYAVALAVRGPVACRLVHWLLGIAFALNVTALARPFLGRRAWWAGAFALLVPAVSNGMSAPLNDVSLAAFSTSAILAWSLFREQPGIRKAALTGVLVGMAMGVKYPALVLAGLIGLTVGPEFHSRWCVRGMSACAVPPIGKRRMGLVIRSLVDRWASTFDANEPRRRRKLSHLFAYVAMAWMIGGAWHVRAWAHTGNPVHPFFRQAFGGAGLDEVLGPEKRPLPVDPVHLLGAILPMTIRPDQFDSFSHQFGPMFLLFLPALLLERPPRRLLGILAIGYLFLLICLTQRQSMRFVLTALGPFCVALAWLANAWWERRSIPGRILVAALLVAGGFESALAVARARHGLPVVLGAESPDAFLARREPTYQVGRWIGENLPQDARIVGQDHRGFYIPRGYAMELARRRRTGLGSSHESAAEIAATFWESGFTHLLLCPPVPETAVEFDPTLGRLLAPWLAGREPLYRQELADADGVVRRYTIYELKEPRLAAAASTPGRPRR